MKHLRQLKDNHPISDEFRSFVLRAAWIALRYLPCICFRCLMLFFVRCVDGNYKSQSLLYHFAYSQRTYTTTAPHHNRFTALFRDHPGEPVPEENFWTLWCKGRLRQTDTPTIQLGATPSGLTSAHLHHPHVFTGPMPFLPPNQQCQRTYTETKKEKSIRSRDSLCSNH